MNNIFKCVGDGKCFSIDGNNEIFPCIKTDCKFQCKPFSCIICGKLLPEFIYNLKGKKCINCDINPDAFNNDNLSTTKLSLDDFIKRMNELPLNERINRFNTLSSSSDHPNFDRLFMLNVIEDSDEYKWLEAEGYIDHKVVLKEKFYEYLPKQLHSYYEFINGGGNPYSEQQYVNMLVHKFYEKWVHIILNNKDDGYIHKL
jgi:hypothetical protein